MRNKYYNDKEYFITYSILINAAQHFGVTTYQEIAQAMGLPMQGSHMGKETGEVLGTISNNEVQAGRPMLSALCVDIHGKPGLGFFNLARELGCFQGAPEDELAFWQAECKAIYAEWKKTYQ